MAEKAERFQFARKFSDKTPEWWSKVIFSDEKTRMGKFMLIEKKLTICKYLFLYFYSIVLKNATDLLFTAQLEPVLLPATQKPSNEVVKHQCCHQHLLPSHLRLLMPDSFKNYS
jgi:hypothetical protein